MQTFSVILKLLLHVDTDGQTGMVKLIGVFHNFLLQTCQKWQNSEVHNYSGNVHAQFWPH